MLGYVFLSYLVIFPATLFPYCQSGSHMTMSVVVCSNDKIVILTIFSNRFDTKYEKHPQRKTLMIITNQWLE